MTEGRLIARMKSEPGRLVSVLGARLCRVTADESLPKASDLGLGALREEATRWQMFRLRSDFNQLAWPGDPSWLPEIHGLFGIAAELVLVSIEAEIEKEMHRRALTTEDRDEGAVAWSSRALRFFAEGQANELVIFGHNVMNLSIRTVALHHDWDPQFLDRMGLVDEAFRPRSDQKGGWASLNVPTAKALRKAGRQLAPGFASLTQSLVDLCTTSPWSSLNDLRGGQYHRWRAESPGVAASNRAYASVWETIDGGKVRYLGGPTHDYTDGQQVVDQLDSLTSETLQHLAQWMPTFTAAWDAGQTSAHESWST